MDAVTYIKEAMRMCKSAEDDCENCPAKVEKFCPVRLSNTGTYKMQGNEKNAVSVVEQWSKDHPVKTRQSEFLKMFPNAQKSGRVLNICPKNLNAEYMPPKRCENIFCSDCKTDYWNEEVSE